jgi:hypothetical protein
MTSKRLFAMSAVALATVVGSAASAGDVLGDFRVLPYLQSPSTDGMIVNWFTSVDQAGTLTVYGPGLASPLSFASTPELLSEIDYATSEKNLNPRPADMQWPDNSNYKHSVTLTGLQPDTVYNYVVEQGSTIRGGTLRTAPLPDSDRLLRFAVLSDSETLVIGRTTNREWSAGAQAPGSTGRPSGTGIGRDRYLLTETVGYQENIKAMKTRQPDLIIMPGDLIQGNGNEPQRRYDEFWRHNAGEYDTILSNIPLIPAIGNNCIFYNSWSNNDTIQIARKQFSAYFDTPSNGFPEFQDLFSRVDYGPVTIITLSSVKGVEPANHLVPERDTNRVWSNLYTFGDVPDFNPGTVQWNWAEQQLADARAAGQIIVVQWHHTPYSRGIHGSATTSPQSGEAMRQYTPLLEQYKVAAVFAGHSEVFERSFLDQDNDGFGINYWDVGAAGDGLRGVETTFDNSFSQWTADQSEGELWNGNTLLEGGKHYGFLEVDVARLSNGEFRVAFQPWHVFPVNQDFVVTDFDLRRYNDRVVLRGPADNLQPIDKALCVADLNADTTVDFSDVNRVLSAFGTNDAEADANGDGVVDFGDLSIVLGAFGEGC